METSSAASNWNDSHAPPRPASVPEKRPNSGGSNNIRNLSIQIVDVNNKTKGLTNGSQASNNSSSREDRRRHLGEYEGEPTPVHPFDEDLAAADDAIATDAVASSSLTTAVATGAPGIVGRTHQTMNRVHPLQDHDFVDSPASLESNNSRSGSFVAPSVVAPAVLPFPDRRASDNNPPQQYQQHYYHDGAAATAAAASQGAGGGSGGGGFGYFDRTSTGSFRPRSLSATTLDPVGNGHGQSLHQQLSWADRKALQMRREGSFSSLSSNAGGGSSGGELSDVVMVKKSAKGRMFTVERTVAPPSSPTRSSSRFIVVSSNEDVCLSTPTPSPLSSPSLH